VDYGDTVKDACSIEGWVSDPRHDAGGDTLALEEGERQNEEAHAHDAEDDNARQESAGHCVHPERGMVRRAWGGAVNHILYI